MGAFLRKHLSDGALLAGAGLVAGAMWCWFGLAATLATVGIELMALGVLAGLSERKPASPGQKAQDERRSV